MEVVIALEFRWDAVGVLTWQRLLQRADGCSLQQAWSYGRAVAAQGHEVRRLLVEENGEAVALVQVALRRLAARLSLALVMRGPVWLVREAARHEADVLAELRRELRGAVLLWSPDDTNAAARRSTHRRVMTGYSTIRLDLRRPPAALRSGLDGKWRNMLVRAEASGLEIRAVGGGHLLHWLIDHNEAYRAKIGYRGPSPAFVRDLGEAQPPGHRLVLVALEKREPVAGVIVDRHGAAATYYAGCTTERGRALRAHHLLLWQAVERLASSGVGMLDLGGIDTDKAAGVARFKLGMGGTPMMLAGTYLVAPWFGAASERKGPQSPAAPFLASLER
ncbi:MAG: GNAT family N-acetyltransferase [Geminicoccaceae bacterium]|nr:GNAT family N-acetyltransferase [Geminicoccaceae bacterium]